MDLNLGDKTVLVTGGATGIGRATVEYLCGQGATVIATGLDAAEGASLEAALGAAGRRCRFVETDVRSTEQVERAVAVAHEMSGALHGLVNGAAVHNPGKRLEDLSDAEWALTIDVNLGGTFRMCRAALPAIRAAGGGAVVNIASVHAIATAGGLADYAASKGAVLALSRQLAIDYACDNIRVNALILGSVDTRMSRGAFEAAGGAEKLGLSFDPNALPRIGTPQEAARTIAFLLSDAAAYLNGSGLVADGGLLARLL